MTIGSMLLAVAVAVVGIGLFIVGFGDGGWPRLLAGGVIIGVGVAAMHYMGMGAMSMPGSMSYSASLVALSVLIAIVAGTAALWIGTWVRSIAATLGAALVMGIAVTGMHYTGMAALHVEGGAMPSMAVEQGSGISDVSGAAAATFLIPLLLVISLATFLLTLSISMTPGEDEIRADAEMRRRLDYLEHRGSPDRGV
jgi:NO-binding membrane sensor protein with MHYT domain